MDALGIGFVVLLVVLSGAVAALGDYLGRRIGKKRLRWGRLRPKHTAIIMTAIAGMLTTFLTILILTLVSEPVRIWLVEGRQVQQDLTNTTEELRTATLNLDRLTDDVAEIRTELNEERAKLAIEQQKVAGATSQAEELRIEAGDLRQQVAEFSQQLKDSADRLLALQEQFNDLDVQKTRLEGDIETYRNVQQELIDENIKLLEKNDKFEEDIAGLEFEITRLSKEVEDTQKAQALASKNFEEVSRQIEADRQAALKELADAESDLAKARSDLRELTQYVEQIGPNSIRSRMNPLIFHLGDELARLPVRTLMSQSEAKTSIRRAIEMASRAAQERGAIDAPNSRNKVSLINYSDPDNNEITIEMQSEAALKLLEGIQEEQLIRVVTRYNSFQEEWVPIRIIVVKNPIVYREGDLIIEGRIDGKAGVQGVYEQLVTFISTQVKDRAINDGMIPAVGRPQVLGEISQEEIQRIVTTIVDADRSVRVRFQAAAEMRAGDQLQLEIVLLR